MPAKLTTVDFIDRAQKVHGNKYDYSKSVYTGKDDKLVIICPVHGEFEQSPNNHWKGKGCPDCQPKHKLTQEEFLEKARSVHGTFYDYTDTVYVSNADKLKIKCPIHGIFEQTANSHLQGHGCPNCGKIKIGQHDYSSRIAKRNHTKRVRSYSGRILYPTKPNTFTGSCRNMSKYARYYQFNEFYKRELALWNENPIYRGIPLQAYLYENRRQYLSKSANELSDVEILRGMTVSGIVKGYTVFDASLMEQVLTTYPIKSVYDPCAGWGERILCCYKHRVSYLGIDINDKLEFGYRAMISDFDMKYQEFMVGDSSMTNLHGKYDAVITCPPYGNIEHYTDIGADAMSDTDFLKWWNLVVSNSLTVHPKYFCFQINRKWRDAMLDIVLQHGFHLESELYFKTNKSSHFTRSHNKNYKVERESMLILCR